MGHLVFFLNFFKEFIILMCACSYFESSMDDFFSQIISLGFISHFFKMCC